MNPGERIIIEFTAVIVSLDASGTILNEAFADYNDPFFFDWYMKHPPVYSNECYYPDGVPLVFPNPFNPDTAINGTLKFGNIVPGSIIQIYTLSGEVVAILNSAETIRVEWNATNRFGGPVSPGIYYYTVKNKKSGQMHKGKLFIVRSN